MHAYNAVHIVRIVGTLEAERMAEAVGRTLEAEGIAGLSLNRRQRTYRFHDRFEPARITTFTTGAGSPSGLHAEIEHEVNTSFVLSEPFVPFRFFVASEKDSFSLGLTYFHPVADAESIVLLLREIIENYQGRKTRAPTRFNLYPPRRDFQPRVFGWKLARLPALVRHLRSSCRPHDRDPGDLSNRFTFFSIDPTTLRRLLDIAKSLGVTLNDLFLALVMKSISTWATSAVRTGSRRNISLGCVVNTRKDFPPDRALPFGLFLGSFFVTHQVPDAITVAELARDLSRQTSRIKQEKLYLGAPLELAFGRFLFSFFPAERKKSFYSKNYPLWGGVTNMNLNALWHPQDDGAPADYFRAVSTGPATPLVLSITSVREVANVGLTYRPTVFSEPEIDVIKSYFLDPLKHL